tara:strand:- start:421 stop:711 length:291 start_codon:yes stop_codon:yes gene_type:complete
LLIRYQKKSREISNLSLNSSITLYDKKNILSTLVKSDFNKKGTDSIGIHWAQYLALTFSSLLIFLISMYKAIPSFKVLILEMIWFLNCSGFNCNGA